MSKIYLGIDIGVNGGIVALDAEGAVLEVAKTPETRTGFHQLISKYSQTSSFCILEKVHSQPKNGGKANFTFGMTTERTLYTLEICKIPFQEVTPQTWLKTYMLKKEKGETQPQWKNRLKERARQIFPNQSITLWNADAFLIAEYCRRHFK